MGLGAFGNKIFEVNLDKIYTFNGLSVGESLNIEQQETDGGKPATYIKGLKEMTISFEIPLLYPYCDVQAEIDWWLLKMRSKTPEYLTLGNKTYGAGKCLLNNVSASDYVIAPNGLYLKAKLNLGFSEWTKAGYKKETDTTTTPTTIPTGTDDFQNEVYSYPAYIPSMLGKRIAKTEGYNNSASRGQCVWYVRGRSKEKLGVDTGSVGNANQMWYNCKKSARLEATENNIKQNIIVSYKFGTSREGMLFGHVIFIEYVDGDKVYYTEGGSGYYNTRTDGVVKLATKAGILNGRNASGAVMGREVIGFIDMEKY